MASNQFSSNEPCEKSLDHVSGLFENSEEWVARCHGNSCIGVTFKVTFRIPVIPHLFCISHRLNFYFFQLISCSKTNLSLK